MNVCVSIISLLLLFKFNFSSYEMDKEPKCVGNFYIIIYQQNEDKKKKITFFIFCFLFFVFYRLACIVTHRPVHTAQNNLRLAERKQKFHFNIAEMNEKENESRTTAAATASSSQQQPAVVAVKFFFWGTKEQHSDGSSVRIS